jgi:hypothetical protein
VYHRDAAVSIVLNSLATSPLEALISQNLPAQPSLFVVLRWPWRSGMARRGPPGGALAGLDPGAGRSQNINFALESS